jgi:hypothetical protein
MAENLLRILTSLAQVDALRHKASLLNNSYDKAPIHLTFSYSDHVKFSDYDFVSFKAK